MAQVETVRGPIDVTSLGITLMHEHVFVRNEEIQRNYPGDWDEQERVDDAAAKLTALRQRGCDTIVDPTVLGLGRDIKRIQRVAARTDLHIIAATGLYTYRDVPFYFRYRGLDRTGAADDPMTRMFVGDITTGIAGTGIKAAFLKCAIDEEGLTPGVERVMRAVAQAHVATGAPITVHTTHAAACHIDWFSADMILRFAPAWHFEHLFDEVLPALEECGVTARQIETMLVDNPRRYFAGG